ncbi:hypothetical protein NYP20_01485 [Pseudomonas sp. N3-W]|uniref:hypothetical protein n=1 Tax=Pseudomonas sp. N3-W TaxID=2975049 RepID=UPI00217E56A1|nr:hypothetical protein [Pseudomonas sp. N3-W]UWF49663.1 hypothetical protein NYP20_01485 [Pseudomonas sp. N3-W]
MTTNQSCLDAGTGTAALKKWALSLLVPLISPALMIPVYMCLEMNRVGVGSNHEAV